MKKRSMLLIAVLMVIPLYVLSMTVHAGPPIFDAQGLWQYRPFVLDTRIADGNTFLKTFEEGVWSGSFSGTSTEDARVVIHSSGAWSYRGIVSFSGEVDDRVGDLTMHVVGKRPDVFTDWTGKWVILSGTEGLSRLRGQGDWWGPGAPAVGEWGDIYYSGKVHFDPD